MSKERWIWVREGDCADYSRWDSLEEAAEYLANFGCVPEQWREGAAGLAIGFDDVSLYWGDEEGELLSGLTMDQRELVEDILLSEFEEDE